MNTVLEKNIVNLYGEKGRFWLDNLPFLIKEIAFVWNLSDIHPVSNMSWNYVATALQNDSLPVVLKISCDQKLITDEYQALQHFSGKGAVKVLAQDLPSHAILLERLLLGISLKEYCAKNIEEKIQIYADVVRSLLSNPMPTDKSFTHMGDWLKAIDRIEDQRIHSAWLEKAKAIKNKILNNHEGEYVCHGDLHFENIIQSGKNWLAIDPKGIVASKAFEAAAFNLLSLSEIARSIEVNVLIQKRIALLADAIQLRQSNLLDCFFLRCMMSAQWFIEDHGDPTQMLTLADYLYRFIE